MKLSDSSLSLIDHDLLHEVRLLVEVMVAAAANSGPLSRGQLDTILGV